MEPYGVNDSNGQGVIAVLLIFVYGFLLPAFIMWRDEKKYVNEVEKEQKDRLGKA
jgi:preprotein translocase subunit YajC